MQGSARRGPGDRQPRGETRKAIVKYLLTDGAFLAPESEIREHLRSVYNIREPKGIRKQLDTLLEAGYLAKYPTQGRDTRWTVNLTTALVEWCRDNFEPETFYNLYSSGPVQEYLEVVNLFPETEDMIPLFKGDVRYSQAKDVSENEETIQAILKWINDAKYRSPSIFFHLRNPTPEITLVASLLNQLAKDHKLSIDVFHRPSDSVIPFFFGLFCRALACVLIDHEKYPTGMTLEMVQGLFIFDTWSRLFLRFFSYDVTIGEFSPMAIAVVGGHARAQSKMIDAQIWLIPYALKSLPTRAE